MKLRYTRGAARQIDAALGYICERSPQGATRVRDRLWELAALLQRHPDAGQTTNRAGVRRIVLNPYPYLIFYRVDRNEIVVLRFRHAARDLSRPNDKL